jgi:hypothetical protein
MFARRAPQNLLSGVLVRLSDPQRGPERSSRRRPGALGEPATPESRLDDTAGTNCQARFERSRWRGIRGRAAIGGSSRSACDRR